MWLTWLYKIGAIVAVAGAVLVGAYVKGRVDGSRGTEAKWQTVIAKAEADWQKRQREAQEAAFKEIEALNEEKEDADRLIEKLRVEAAADPDAARNGINADSVRRIARIH